MSAEMARDLQGKSIVGTDGTTYGTLYDITMDRESGLLCDLVIDPSGQFSARTEADDGRLRIPVEKVKTMNDQIVIDVNRSS